MTTDDTSSMDANVVRRAWSRSTSASPEKWTRANPALGQCAVTALVVQDCCGGDLVRTIATLPDGTTESHYANFIGDEEVIYDLTEQQFPEGTEFGEWEQRERGYVLSFPDTQQRYVTLCRRLNEIRVLDQMASMP